MTTRPIFIPGDSLGPLVFERRFEFGWSPGFAPSQKRKNVVALHAAATAGGVAPVLELSTKSDEPLGRELSAFNLLVSIEHKRTAPLEVVYQASKRFANGGPFGDLLAVEPREAKRDPRLRESGPLVAFSFAGREYALHPPTAFYDWLYLRALQRVPQLFESIRRFAAFSDIEFNPARSLNCQARSCAVAVSLARRGILVESARSFDALLRAMHEASSSTSRSVLPWQMELTL